MVQSQFEPKQSDATAYAFHHWDTALISLIPGLIAIANDQYFKMVK